MSVMTGIRTHMSLTACFCFCFFVNFRKSLDLVETLLKLAEAGKYDQVKSLFGFPIKHCPDMLLLALLQVQVRFRVVMLSSTIPAKMLWLPIRNVTIYIPCPLPRDNKRFLAYLPRQYRWKRILLSESQHWKGSQGGRGFGAQRDMAGMFFS